MVNPEVHEHGPAPRGRNRRPRSRRRVSKSAEKVLDATSKTRVIRCPKCSQRPERDPARAVWRSVRSPPAAAPRPCRPGAATPPRLDCRASRPAPGHRHRFLRSLRDRLALLLRHQRHDADRQVVRLRQVHRQEAHATVAQRQQEGGIARQPVELGDDQRCAGDLGQVQRLAEFRDDWANRKRSSAVAACRSRATSSSRIARSKPSAVSTTSATRCAIHASSRRARLSAMPGRARCPAALRPRRGRFETPASLSRPPPSAPPGRQDGPAPSARPPSPPRPRRLPEGPHRP